MAKHTYRYLVCYQYEGRMNTTPCVNRNGDIDSELYSPSDIYRYLRPHNAEDISICGLVSDKGPGYICNDLDVAEFLYEVTHHMHLYEVMDFTITENSFAGDREETYFTITRVL